MDGVMDRVASKGTKIVITMEYTTMDYKLWYKTNQWYIICYHGT